MPGVALGLPVAGIPRLVGPPEDSTHGLRELAVGDLDGNVLPVGSFLASRESR